MGQPPIRYLILPGWKGSAANHWQTHWQYCLPNARRVEQDDWTYPDCRRWQQALEQQVLASPSPVIVIAHSLGCLTLVHWAARAGTTALKRLRGALLVAPADVERADCPPPLQNFAPIPRMRLPFPSLLIGSDNDPAASPGKALELAGYWGCEARILTGAGHINVASGHHCWASGFAYLYQLQTLIGQQDRTAVAEKSHASPS